VPTPDEDAVTRGHVLAVGLATGATVLVLLGLLGASVATGRLLSREHEREPLRIEVTGKQFWWQVRYPAEPPSDVVVTANELHVPTGRTIRLELRADDVVHSFWVPQLHGKRDLIPGRLTDLQFRVDRAGTYTGQCAEFCGVQHAHMLIRVVAEDGSAFEDWRRRQRVAARTPETPDQQRGQGVFMTQACVLCHTIRGTDAGGQSGPDLTHLASRRFIAAGALPNTRGHLAGWVLDSQAAKPGNRMPPVAIAGPDLQALLAYLESLE
jgi:cytochrome c oxidase subunit II